MEAPDVVITDIRMPSTHTDDGLRAALAVRAARPETGVGYLLKQRIADAESFCRDVRRVADEGETVLDPEVVLARARHDTDALDGLTPRQGEVLALIAEGRSNAAIARRLVITEKAVVHHASHIDDQLGLAVSDDDHRRVLAVVRYLTRA